MSGMRWEPLSANGPDAGAARAAPPLPLALPGSVVRTFDTPGFAGMTFYEVQAKSIINRVPGASRVPFEWTINPYRGCGHACVYCLAGDTPILMADGRTRALADVKVGDVVYGTVGGDGHRQYRPTPVLAHWSTVKPAFRITLRDGTELVASGDHRFLTGRGWKYVTGDDRPRLSTAHRLVGTGRFAPPPPHTSEYRRGYLCGVIRGDPSAELSRFRLALTDPEALRRAERWLLDVGLATTRVPVSSGRAGAITIRTSTRTGSAGVRRLISWPEDPRPGWRLGFLAGLYDAQGSYVDGVLRMSDGEPAILAVAVASLERLRFEVTQEVTREVGDRPAVGLRIRGGTAEHLRFFHTVDPAVTRRPGVTRLPRPTRAGLAATPRHP